MSLTLTEINNMYINESTICAAYKVNDIKDNTKYHYYIELINGKRIEITKTKYDELTT